MATNRGRLSTANTPEPSLTATWLYDHLKMQQFYLLQNICCNRPQPCHKLSVPLRHSFMATSMGPTSLLKWLLQMCRYMVLLLKLWPIGDQTSEVSP